MNRKRLITSGITLAAIASLTSTYRQGEGEEYYVACEEEIENLLAGAQMGQENLIILKNETKEAEALFASSNEDETEEQLLAIQEVENVCCYRSHAIRENDNV